MRGTVGVHDKELEHVAIKQVLSDRLSQDGRKTPLRMGTFQKYLYP